MLRTQGFGSIYLWFWCFSSRGDGYPQSLPVPLISHWHRKAEHCPLLKSPPCPPLTSAVKCRTSHNNLEFNRLYLVCLLNLWSLKRHACKGCCAVLVSIKPLEDKIMLSHGFSCSDRTIYPELIWRDFSTRTVLAPYKFYSRKILGMGHTGAQALGGYCFSFSTENVLSSSACCPGLLSGYVSHWGESQEGTKKVILRTQYEQCPKPRTKASVLVMVCSSRLPARQHAAAFALVTGQGWLWCFNLFPSKWHVYWFLRFVFLSSQERKQLRYWRVFHLTQFF